MAPPNPPQEAGLLCGLIAAGPDALGRGKERLVQAFGEIAVESETFPFGFTAYYDREMGAGLIRQFVGFRRLVRQDQLVDIKLLTGQMEAELGTRTSGGLRRSVNLDPGYVTLAKVVLATTKDRDHRIYLGEGVFAEVTLRWTRGRLTPQPWTYPDYCSEQATAFLGAMRAYVHRALEAAS